MNIHEEKFIDHFVRNEKRKRLKSFFDKDKNRWKGLLEIEHYNEKVLDKRFTKVYENKPFGNKELISILKSKGASNKCYVISNCSDLDEQEMDLTDAINEVIGVGMGTLISCIPGQLAYYEGELGDQVILENKNT